VLLPAADPLDVTGALLEEPAVVLGAAAEVDGREDADDAEAPETEPEKEHPHRHAAAATARAVRSDAEITPSR
jgi:hypothetical protein